MRFSTITTLLLSAGFAQALPCDNDKRSKTKGLDWKPCDEELFREPVRKVTREPVECATIEVPLDYTDENSKPLDLILIRVKATKPSKGSVLMNPGGPGGSGLDFIAVSGPDFRE